MLSDGSHLRSSSTSSLESEFALTVLSRCCPDHVKKSTSRPRTRGTTMTKTMAHPSACFHIKPMR